MKTLALGKKDSAFYKSLESVMQFFGDVIFKSEHDFPKLVELIKFITENNINKVLMPNPYGNTKRLACYKKLKECNIEVICSDRGSLPNSWFFDSGFNADSQSFNQILWDSELKKDELDYTKKFIDREINNKYLEAQDSRLGAEAFISKYKIPNKKIIFIPLQRPGDTVIKYFSDPCGGMEGFIDYISIVEHELNKENEEYLFILKKHPLELNTPEFKSDNIKFIHDDANIEDLIDIASHVMLINSGVGVLALTKFKSVISCGDAFYAKPGLAFAAKNTTDIIEAIKNNHQPKKESVFRFIHHLIKNVYSFGKFDVETKKEGSSLRTITRKITFNQLIINRTQVNIDAKKILVVSPVIPFPIYRGSQTRVDSFIRKLLEGKNRVYLCILNSSFGNKKSIDISKELSSRYPSLDGVKVIKDPKYFTGIKKITNKINILSDKITLKSSLISNNLTCPSVLKKVVSNICKEYKPDILFVNYAKLSGVIPDNFPGKKILDSHDYQTQFLLEDQKLNNKNTHINSNKFRKSEHIALNKFDTVIAINPLEKELFDNEILTNKSKSFCVPAFFEKNWKAKQNYLSFNHDILFVGSVSNFNVNGLKWFLDNCLPELNVCVPNLKVTVAGNINRSKELKVDKYPSVKFLGVVDNLSSLYETSKIVIAPILGGAGMKIKVIEALSYGKAIVATSKAMDGINHEKYNAVRVSDTANEFTKDIIELLSNDSHFNTQVENAKKLFLNEHSDVILSDSIENILS